MKHESLQKGLKECLSGIHLITTILFFASLIIIAIVDNTETSADLWIGITASVIPLIWSIALIIQGHKRATGWCSLMFSMGVIWVGVNAFKRDIYPFLMELYPR